MTSAPDRYMEILRLLNDPTLDEQSKRNLERRRRIVDLVLGDIPRHPLEFPYWIGVNVGQLLAVDFDNPKQMEAFRHSMQYPPPATVLRMAADIINFVARAAFGVRLSHSAQDLEIPFPSSGESNQLAWKIIEEFHGRIRGKQRRMTLVLAAIWEAVKRLEQSPEHAAGLAAGLAVTLRFLEPEFQALDPVWVRSRIENAATGRKGAARLGLARTAAEFAIKCGVFELQGKKRKQAGDLFAKQQRSKLFKRLTRSLDPTSKGV